MNLAVDRGLGTQLELELQDGAPLTDEVKSRIYSKITITRCKPNCWPHVIEGIPGFLFVTQTAKNIVEDLEPNIHEFVSLEVEDQSGNADVRMFLLHCRNRIQAVIINKSDEVYVKQRPPELINGRWVTYSRGLLGGGQPRMLVLDSNRIAGKHLWTGLRLQFGGSYFCSEALKAAFDKIDSGLRFDFVREQPGEPGDQY